MQATAISPARFSAAANVTVAIEGTWLLAAFLVPAAVAPSDFMMGFIQIPKVFVLRTLALLVIALMAFDWASRRGRPGALRYASSRTGVRGLLDVVRAHPARWVVYAAAAVLVANLISAAFSPVRAIAIGGIDPGWDTYGLASVGSYLVMFAAMSVYLRTRTQINRLLWTLTAVSMLVSIYGIFQHFGTDPLRDLGAPESRARLTFGNPIFAASFLLMTVPLTLAVILPYRDRMIAGTHIWIGAGILALQLTAILFTLSRGPWVGFVVGMMVLFAAMAWTMGWRALSRPVGMFLVGAAIALIMNALPVEGGPGGTAALNERLGSLPSALGGGLANRQVIWETAAEVYFTVPWLDTQQNPEIPDLIVPALRPLVGYGPDMFGYAYPLASDSRYTKDLASHGHNFIVHTAIELGFFGVLAYVGLIVALALALFRLLKGAKAGLYPDWFTYLLIALSGALVSRVVEQIFGKAQVSDLMLSWMLAALVGVLALIAPRLRAEPVSDTGPPAAVPQGRRSASRARRQRRQSDIRLSPLLKLAAAAALAVTILLLWWTAVVPNVRSAIVALDARVAADLGEAQEGVDRYIEAIDLAPSSAVPKLALGQLLFTAALQDAPLTIEQRLDLFDAAYAQVQEVLERNPLDHRAWSRSGEFLRERAALAQQVGADAIHENQILVDLMPGFWQARTGLAWSYVRLGNFELALDAIEEAKRLRGLESNGAHLIFFIEAAALERLGRFDEAIAAAQLSMERRESRLARDLLDRLADGRAQVQ